MKNMDIVLDCTRAGRTDGADGVRKWDTDPDSVVTDRRAKK